MKIINGFMHKSLKLIMSVRQMRLERNELKRINDCLESISDSGLRSIKSS